MKFSGASDTRWTTAVRSTIEMREIVADDVLEVGFEPSAVPRLWV
jgi:hypothetical protein